MQDEGVGVGGGPNSEFAIMTRHRNKWWGGGALVRRPTTSDGNVITVVDEKLAQDDRTNERNHLEIKRF